MPASVAARPVAPAAIQAGWQPRPRRPELSIVSPTFNEKGNLGPLLKAIGAAMGGTAWELIVVDDDSPDGTAAEANRLARQGAPVRCIRRVGRRGLSSAVVEGLLSATAPIVAVIDADLQHDERLLPAMLGALRTTDVDVVVGSRYVDGGSLGTWDERRRRISAMATWCSRLLVGTEVTDPMSGFFMMRRSVFEATLYDLSQQGYKILLDVLTAAPRKLAVLELPYRFRNRQAGESKLDTMIALEFVFLLVEKFTRGLLPPRFVLFALVGGCGLAVHLAALAIMDRLGFLFLPAQIVATLCAMTFNFVVNNAITYRSERLKGLRFAVGYALFCAVCSFGAIANISVANLTIAHVQNWPLAGVAGAVMSSVFNFGVATRLVWRPRRHRSRNRAGPAFAPR